jgi:Lrp/AsnC family leucine-responsive transcriptional regulator
VASNNASQLVLDDIDWRIIDALQKDARLSFTALGQLIGLSRPAVAERVHRLEELGVITGYRAMIDLTRIGRNIVAFIRLSTPSNSETEAAGKLISSLPQVQECYRSLGDDCFIIKVVVASIGELDTLLEALKSYGKTSTTVTLSQLIAPRAIRIEQH